MGYIEEVSFLVKILILEACKSGIIHLGWVTVSSFQECLYRWFLCIYRCCVLQAILPVAKLCALVTMQRMAGHNTQTFSLPMTLIDKDTQVQYVTLCVSSIEVYLRWVYAPLSCLTPRCRVDQVVFWR